jgi:sterol-4alpha-carboxylate 3-dehydrogenase (decarboxylating)
MLRASRRGQSKFQLGSNDNLFDWTYVENVAHAHLLAVSALLQTSALSTMPLDHERVDGEVFFITNDSPVYFWDFARTVWKYGGDTAGMDLARVWTLSADFGMFIAHLLSWILWVFGKTPNLSPSSVKFSTITRFYDITKAKTRLGYLPIVPLEEGIRRGVRQCLESGELDQTSPGEKKRQ